MQQCLIAAPLTNMNENLVLCTDASDCWSWKNLQGRFADAQISLFMWNFAMFTSISRMERCMMQRGNLAFATTDIFAVQPFHRNIWRIDSFSGMNQSFDSGEKHEISAHHDPRHRP